MRDIQTFVIDKLTEIQAKEDAVWVPAKDGNTGFQTLTALLLSEYLETIKKEQESALCTVNHLMGQAENIKEQIHTLSNYTFMGTPMAVKNALIGDINTNSGILEKLLKERKEYLEYLKNSIKEIKERHTTDCLSNKEHTVLDKISDVVKELFQRYIEVVAETIRRFEAQKGALIKIDELTHQEAVLRLGGKIELLKKELARIEKEIVSQQEEITLINNEMDKIKQTEAAVADIRRSTKTY